MTNEITELDEIIEHFEMLKAEDESYVAVHPSDFDASLRFSDTTDNNSSQMSVEGVGYFDWNTFEEKGIAAVSKNDYTTFLMLVVPREVLTNEALESNSE